jgi:hypothetical protein
VSVSLAAAGVGSGHAQLAASSKAAGLEQCVEPTAFMRKNHMEVLLHQRDKTTREGIRTPDHSLVECVSCHAGRDDDGNFVPINARGQFCADCHTRVAVDIDCFQCHATRPEADARGGEHPAIAWTPAYAGAQYCLKMD